MNRHLTPGPGARLLYTAALLVALVLASAPWSTPAYAQPSPEAPDDPSPKPSDDDPPKADPSDEEDPRDLNNGPLESPKDGNPDGEDYDEDYDDEDYDDEDYDEDPNNPLRLNGIDIFSTPEDLARLGGSANLLDEETLETFEYDDPHSVLLQVPGLYVRQEDGFGLRPNIGLRGANSSRSSKITLMEDGVLFGPAPYAAPAAYYFPMMTRMTAVEVFKGPGSILYGPNTIGGAVNVKTRDIPVDSEGRVDLALGSYLTGKAHLYYGASTDWGGFLVEGVHLQSDGFKELDGGGDTGFNKQELMLKMAVNSDLDAETFHRLQLKFGVARELSNETYLGLTDADFGDTPNRRYPASALDEMSWFRTQAVLTHRMEIGEDFDLTTNLYRHDFTRLWSRLNRFRDGPTLSEILTDPTSGQRQVFYDVLTGNQDTSSDAETLLVVNNDRTFISQGVQTVARWRLGGVASQASPDGDSAAFGGAVSGDAPPAEATSGWGWSNELSLGVRLHNDQVERDHAEDSYAMIEGRLEADGGDRQPVVLNKGEALALAVYLFDTLTLHRLTIAPGLRIEHIRTEFEDELADTSQDNTQTIAIPGLGLFYAFTNTFGVLAGVHRGFSPVSPGQGDGVEPETSINYEAGLRYLNLTTGSQLELIGFFNDYNNLTGECTFAAGCTQEQLDNQFNAGEVNVYGLEALAAHRIPLTDSLAVPLRATYTYTRSRFLADFISANPQFGEVSEGDELPYVPRHQANGSVGLDGGFWGLTLGATFVDEMQETAGESGALTGLKTDRYLMLDAAGYISPLDWLEFYGRADNLTNTSPLASRRPFGARPTRPFLAQGGVKVSF